MTPSQAAATPIVARNAGRRVVAISCDQSLNRDASPTPTTVRFSHGRRRFWPSGILGIARQSQNIVPCRDGSGLEVTAMGDPALLGDWERFWLDCTWLDPRDTAAGST